MSTLRRIEKMEAAISPGMDRDAWFTEHKAEIEKETTAIWNSVGPDLERFIGWLKDGSFIPFGRYPADGERFNFWVPRNSVIANPAPVGSCEIARQVDGAMREYFEQPEDGDEEIRHKPGEVWPLTLPESVAFLESHLEPIAGWMTLHRFRESDYFQSIGTRRFVDLIPEIHKALSEENS